MKRIELLKAGTKQEDVQKYESIVKKDKLTLENIKSSKNLELLKAEESIEGFLLNSKNILDDQFITLIRTKKEIESDINIIDTILNTYL